MIRDGTCPQEDGPLSAMSRHSLRSFNLNRPRRCSPYESSPLYFSTLVPSALSLAFLDQHCLAPLLPKGHRQLCLSTIDQYGTTYSTIPQNIRLTSLRLTLDFQLTFGVLRKGLISAPWLMNIHTRRRRATSCWTLSLSSITSVIAIAASSHR